MSPEEIDIREEPIREILSKPPQWLLRWGVTLIAGVVGLILLLSFLLKYPDTLTGQVSITTTALPMSIKARSSGYLSDLRVKEGAQVEKDQILGIVQNTANNQDLIGFYQQWQPFHQALMQSDSVASLSLPTKANYGSLQEVFIQLLSRYQAYQQFLKKSSYAEQLQQNLRLQEGAQQALGQLLSQEPILKQRLQVANKQYETDEQLQQKGAITARELESSKQQRLQEEMNWKQWEASKLQAELRLRELSGESLGIKQAFERELTTYKNTLREASLGFASAYANWEQQYVLKASISGKVNLFQLWSERQWVEAGQEVMVISPDSQELFGQLLVDQAGAGQLKEGQKVYIKLSGYPSERFGQVKGKVLAVSSIAREGKYAVKVALPNGLQTTYDKSLPFHQEMQGQASVITEDLRLIQRFFYELRALWEENS